MDVDDHAPGVCIATESHLALSRRTRSEKGINRRNLLISAYSLILKSTFGRVLLDEIGL